MVHGFLPLTDHGLIIASGADTRTFLHGQLTSDMVNLRDDKAQLAGYCSAKGRLLALFTAFAQANGDVLLECDNSLLPQTLKRLQMFVLRAQCKLRNADTEYSIYGIAHIKQQYSDIHATSIWGIQNLDWGSLMRLPDAGQLMQHWLIVSAAQAEQAQAKLSALPQITRAQWDALQVQAAVPRITAAVTDQFVPQMVNLEALGGVNFKKGCYPGQEVVARSQYRGTLKRRMFPVHAIQGMDSPTATFSSGQEIFLASDSEQPAGMVVMGTQGYALAELKLSALEAINNHHDSLHLASAAGAAIGVDALPYVLPTDV
jgi:tRNA-modifying protein YgfZ